MADNTKPQADTSKMTGEYIKGVSIADLAEKYNLTAEEVTAAVTRDAEATPAVTQASEDVKQTVETKKESK